MDVQQMIPQEQKPKRLLTIWMRVRTGFLALLALLWRLIAWMWGILVIGIIVGVLGNALFTVLTTGKIDLTRTFLVIAWLTAHLFFCISILMPVLAITLCSFLAHQWKQRVARESQSVYDQSLVVIAKGFQRALDELQAKPVTHHALPSPSVSMKEDTALPKAVWNVPYRRNPFFTGRENLLEQLHENLTTTKVAALTQAQAISGLGGIGKTQIAVEYTYLYRDEYQYVLWVSAASRDTLFADFVSLAGLLALPEKNEQDQNIIVAAVKHWLEQYDRWLLILDNADDLVMTRSFLPTGDKGHILLTTRAQAVGSLAQSIEVEKMNLEEGMMLLLRRAKVLTSNDSLDHTSQEDRDKAKAIVTAMDGLPLALDQAGAYIEETGCGLSGYWSAYQIHHVRLLQRRGELAADYPQSVAKTWSLSFEKIEQTNHAAADLLHLCAFLYADAIPEEIITENATDLGPLLGPVAANALEIDEAIEVLRKYSLIRRNPNTRSLTIHRLVQVVVKDTMDEATQRQWAVWIVRVINRVFPRVEVAMWHRCQRYLPHAQTCATLIDQWNLAFPEAARLLDQAGFYLHERAQYTDAEPLLQRALAIREQVLGSAHPDTATSFNDLAILYEAQGKYEQAEPLYQRALVIREQVLGPSHPRTTVILNNLAQLYRAQGKYEQAEAFLQRALALREQAQGPKHPRTATILNNLGMLYYDQGKYEQAEPLLQRALAIREQVLGPEHP
jgi:tetratricopeptide (TPR) repeat protein